MVGVEKIRVARRKGDITFIIIILLVSFLFIGGIIFLVLEDINELYLMNQGL